MGLSDRDYMRERPLLEPPKPKPTSLLAMALIFLVLLSGLYKAFALWGPTAQPHQQINLPTVPYEQFDLPRPPGAPTSGGGVAKPDVNSIAASQAAPTQRQNTVTKCVKDGKITFTDGACPDGAVWSTVNADNPMVGTVAPPRQNWSVPQALTPDQVYEGQPNAVVITQSTQSNRAQECMRLSKLIEQLDAMARQPLPGVAQDHIRADRAKLRKRQADLKC